MPYGLISPLAGTVEATLLMFVNLARNGPELALEVVVAVFGAAAASDSECYACEGKD